MVVVDERKDRVWAKWTRQENLLAAINIAVLLFEIASPVRNSDIENLSLPLMYGAKINDLILSGEWWRLLTPMCLICLYKASFVCNAQEPCEIYN